MRTDGYRMAIVSATSMNTACCFVRVDTSPYRIGQRYAAKVIIVLLWAPLDGAKNGPECFGPRSSTRRRLGFGVINLHPVARGLARGSGRIQALDQRRRPPGPSSAEAHAIRAK